MSERYYNWTNYETAMANEILRCGLGFNNYSAEELRKIVYNHLKTVKKSWQWLELKRTWFPKVNWEELANNYKDTFSQWLTNNYLIAGLGQSESGEDLMFYLSKNSYDYFIYSVNQLRETWETEIVF